MTFGMIRGGQALRLMEHATSIWFKLHRHHQESFNLNLKLFFRLRGWQKSSFFCKIIFNNNKKHETEIITRILSSDLLSEVSCFG